MKTIKKNSFFAIIVCILLSFSCKEKEANYAIITGEIENYNKMEMLISRKFSIDENNNLNKLIKINEDKTFTDTIYMNNEGIYQLTNYAYDLYLKPGDSINMKVDAKNFRAPFTFIGGDTEINEYRISKKESLKELLPSFRTYVKFEEEDYVALFSKVKTTFNNLLEPLKVKHPKFYELEKRSIDHLFKYRLSEYKKYHREYANKPEFKISDATKAIIEDMDYDNASDLEFSSNYKSLLRGKFLTNLDDTDGINNMFSNIKALKSKNIKNYLLSSMNQYLKPDNEHLDLFYAGIKETLSDSSALNEISTTYKKAKRLSKGEASFPFNFINHKGGETSSEELKGKYLYIDMWATWCGPCKYEIPFLEKVEKKYHNANIEFVSISIDSKKELWRKFVEEKHLGGIQLLADNAGNSEIMKNYGITGIPQFMLFDPKGNIITVNAPRPSQIINSDYLDKILANKP